jgi:hypothetical protein
MKRNAQNPVCCPDSKAAYLIKYHYERLVTAADHLGWYDTNKRLKGPVDLFNRIQTAVAEHKKKTGNKCPFKVRDFLFFLHAIYPIHSHTMCVMVLFANKDMHAPQARDSLKEIVTIKKTSQLYNEAQRLTMSHRSEYACVTMGKWKLELSQSWP